MDESNFRDNQFAESIAASVLPLLERDRFFERLDERFSPRDPAKTAERCDQSFRITTEILREIGMDSEAIQDVIAVLCARGACCDCEVLYSLAEQSRLKSAYWKTRYHQLQGEASDSNTDR